MKNDVKTRICLSAIGFLVILIAGARAQSTDAFLNSLDLNLSQYNERMGLSLWIFDQNIAQRGMGPSREVVAKGNEIIKGGKARVTYHPLAQTLAEEFAASRTSDPIRRRELIQTYNQFLGRFRDAQRNENLEEHDVAATLGVAFASYYEIYSNGQKSNATQDRDIVGRFRQSLLKNAFFQGTTDHYRQLLDENTAVQTVAALVEYRDAVKRGDRSAVEKERQQALVFLDFYWTGDESQARKIHLTTSGFRD